MKRLLPILFLSLAGSMAYADTLDTASGVYDMGGKLLIDRSIEVTGAVQADRYYDIVGISSPTTPPSGHARLYLSSSTYQYCAKFDNGSTTCLGSGGSSGIAFSTIQPITYNTGTATFSLGLVSLSTNVVGSLPLVNGGLGTVPACRGTDDYAAFHTLDIVTTGYIVVPSSGCTFNTSGSFSNTLFFLPGTGITINSGKTLTLAHPPVASPTQVFYGAGTVSITAANSPLFAEWWGAVAYPSATTSASSDSAGAFGAADNAATNGGTIQALSGHYKMNSTVTQSHTNLLGEGRWNTVFEPGSAMVYYSTMSMFSWNYHYAHYEGFQVNSNVATSSFTVFLSSNGAGGERVRDIQIFNAGAGIWMPTNNGAHISDMFIDGVSTGIYTGGSTGLFAGDVYWNDITIIPYLTAPKGICWIMDKNSSAFYITNLTTLAGIGGVWLRGLPTGYTGSDSGPSNMIFHHPLINAHDSFGIRIDRGLYTTLDDNPIINGMASGPGFYVNPSTPAYVDGLEIDNALVNGNGAAGVDFAGCNLTILGGNYFANYASSEGVHIGKGACGLVKLQGLMAGTTIWANAANGQAYGILIDAGALGNQTNPDNGNVFFGRLVMTDNMLAGNVTAPYGDNSTISSTQKMVAHNLTGLTPNFSYGNGNSAAVFTGNAYFQNEIVIGKTAGLGQTAEIARYWAGTDQNLVLAGAQTFATGATLLSLLDANTLAPFQFRGSKFYWAGSDGNFGINNSAPATLVHVSSGILTVDGGGSGIITTSSVTASLGLVGTTTNDNAPAGNVGAYLSSATSAANFPLTTTFGNTASIVLTAGDWDVDIRIEGNTNNAASVSFVACGLGTAAGNDASNLADGTTFMRQGVTSNQYSSVSLSGLRVSVSGSTTYYLKVNASFASTTPQYYGIISARRRR